MKRYLFLLATVAVILYSSLFPDLSYSSEEIEVGIQLKQPREMEKLENRVLKKIKPLKVFPLKSKPYKISISPDGSLSALCTKNGRIEIYNLEKLTLDYKETVSSLPIYGLAFHPQKNQLTFGDRGGIIKVIDIDTKQTIKTLYESGKIISDITYSPDGTVLGVAHFEGEVTFYDTKKFSFLKRIKFTPKSIYSLRFSIDNFLLSLGARDKKVWIAPLGEGIVKTLKDHSSLVLATDWHKDNYFASGGSDGKMLIYKREGNEVKEDIFFTWIHRDWVTSLKFFKNRIITVSKDGFLRVFDFKKKKISKIVTVAEPILGVDIKGKYLCLITPDNLLVYRSKDILK